MSLYRFIKKEHAESFLQGVVSFGHWSIYKDDGLTEAQIDDESKRKFKANPNNLRIVINGVPMGGVRGFEVKYEAKKNFHCYILSLTTELDANFFNLFHADSCIEIINEKEFVNRLHKVLDREGLKCYCGIVDYYSEDNLLTSIKNYVDIIFKKNSKYAYQKEYRFAIASLHDLDKDRLNIDIACIKDICKIHYKT